MPDILVWKPKLMVPRFEVPSAHCCELAADHWHWFRDGFSDRMPFFQTTLQLMLAGF